MLQRPMYGGSTTGAGCYGVAMAPGGGVSMMPNAGMMPTAYGPMPAMYNIQPVSLSTLIFISAHIVLS